MTHLHDRRLSRRDALRLFAATTLFVGAGCAAPSGSPAQPTTVPAAAPSPTTAPAKPAAQPTTAPAAKPAADSSSLVTVAGETVAYRVVGHAQGETRIPANPKRVVSIPQQVTDNMLALGVKPVGVATFTGRDFESFRYLEPQLQGVPIIGQFVEPKAEAVLAVNPDLIIGTALNAKQYDQLSQIAPTVLLPHPVPGFRYYLRNVGTVLGRSAEAERRIQQYEQKAAEARERLKRAVGDQTVAFLRVLPKEIRLYGHGPLVAPILYGDLGLTPARMVNELAGNKQELTISLEQLPRLDAEHLFLLDQTEDQMRELKASPLWQSLPAVRQGHVYPVKREIWINLGVLGSELVIDAVLEALAR